MKKRSIIEWDIEKYKHGKHEKILQLTSEILKQAQLRKAI
jgi:hypothetical protein